MSSSSASYSTYQEAAHKIKYLVPYDICMGQFIKILRDKLKIQSSTALFFFVNNKLFGVSYKMAHFEETTVVMDAVYATIRKTLYSLSILKFIEPYTKILW